MTQQGPVAPAGPAASGAEPAAGTEPGASVGTRSGGDPPTRGAAGGSTVPFYGSVVISNPEGLLAEIGDQLMPPGMGMMLSGPSSSARKGSKSTSGR